MVKKKKKKLKMFKCNLFPFTTSTCNFPHTMFYESEGKTHLLDDETVMSIGVHAGVLAPSYGGFHSLFSCHPRMNTMISGL